MFHYIGMLTLGILGLFFLCICYVQVKNDEKAKTILAIWLKNEKIVQLLKKSQLKDFVWQPNKNTSVFWFKDSYHTRLLKEYVNDEKIFYRSGVGDLVLYEFYKHQKNDNDKSQYQKFKQSIELDSEKYNTK